MSADLLAQGDTASAAAESIGASEKQFARESGNWIIVDPDVTALSGVVEEAHRLAGLPSGVVTFHTPVNRWDPRSLEPIGARSIVSMANASIRFITVDRTPSAKVLNLVPSEALLVGIEQSSRLHLGTASVVTVDDAFSLSDRGKELTLLPGFTVLTEHPRQVVPMPVSPLADDFSGIAAQLGILEVTLPALRGASSDVAATIARSLRAIKSSLTQLQSPAISAMPSEVAARISDSLQAIEKSLSQLKSATASAEAVRVPDPQQTEPLSAGNRAVQAVEDLQQWLDLTVDQVAELTRTSRSAIHYWKRENALPRPETARHLFKVHALVRALKAATEPDPPLSTLTATPVRGGLSAFELLKSGDYDQAETLVRNLLFGEGRLPTDHRTPDLEGDSIPGPQATGLGLKTPVNRARRVKLTRK